MKLIRRIMRFLLRNPPSINIKYIGNMRGALAYFNPFSGITISWWMFDRTQRLQGKDIDVLLSHVISHEYIHYILLREEGFSTTTMYDNIASNPMLDFRGDRFDAPALLITKKKIVDNDYFGSGL